ncbi:hypothetical protein GCM10009826_31540 [Humibacillus xanthopallidus]
MAKVTALTTKRRTTALIKRRIMYVSKGFGRTRWWWDQVCPTTTGLRLHLLSGGLGVGAVNGWCGVTA